MLDEQVDYVANRIRQGVTAWICASDWAGYRLSRGLMDRGFKIPQDVSITGFDHAENDRLGCPKLTTMAVPFLKIGAESLRRVISRVLHVNRPKLNVRLQCKFVKGKTTSEPFVTKQNKGNDKNDL